MDLYADLRQEVVAQDKVRNEAELLELRARAEAATTSLSVVERNAAALYVTAANELARKEEVIIALRRDLAEMHTFSSETEVAVRELLEDLTKLAKEVQAECDVFGTRLADVAAGTRPLPPSCTCAAARLVAALLDVAGMMAAAPAHAQAQAQARAHAGLPAAHTTDRGAVEAGRDVSDRASEPADRPAETDSRAGRPFDAGYRPHPREEQPQRDRVERDEYRRRPSDAERDEPRRGYTDRPRADHGWRDDAPGHSRHQGALPRDAERDRDRRRPWEARERY